jgi:uncharacterized protein YciI
MFMVLLEFAENRARAPEWMDGHKAWLQQGFEEGVFAASGSLAGQQGGAILAFGLEAAELEHRLSQDPFVMHGVVKPNVIEVSLTRTDPRLDFLRAVPA